ncbi:MAG: dockerin type I domain-containing protein, partial [Chthoniobacterales bacterium]
KPGGQTSNTIYLGYQAANSHQKVAVSRDQGATWTNDQEVGQEFGIQNSTFPELVAGDDNRAAYAFFGTTVAGNYTSQASFPPSAPWHLYIATTFDGGVTWTTIDATPNDPVQRGSICNLGTTSCMNTPNDRNLLDFMDETVDAQGRTLVGYPDGCVGTCVNGSVNSFTALASIARQSGGKRLFAAYDPNPAEPVAPAPPRVDSVVRDGTGLVTITWSAPDNGGSPIVSYNVYRRTSSGTYGAPLASVPAGTLSYVDTTADSSTAYFYKVTAVNALGEGLNCGEFPISAPPPTNPCVGTGFLVDSDPTGDQVAAPMNSDLDIQSVLVAEPYQSDGINRLVFTMKVDDLSVLQPNRQYRIVWTPPTPPAMAGTDRYYVGMNTNAGGAGAATFEYGFVTSQGNVPLTQGTPDAGSVDATGVIQIAIANNKVGNPGAGATLSLLSGRNFAGNGNATITKTSAIDSTADGSYTLIGNNACAPAPTIASAVSRKTHGSMGAFDISLIPADPGGSVECRLPGANGSYQVVVTFTAPVTFTGASATNGASATASPAPGSSASSVVTIDLSNVPDAQTTMVTLAGVRTAGAAADITVPLPVLLGDTNGDRFVNAADATQTRNASGEQVDESNFRIDLNVDGVINSADATIARNSSGHALPGSTSNPPQTRPRAKPAMEAQ